jgi:hypothetical protein
MGDNQQEKELELVFLIHVPLPVQKLRCHRQVNVIIVDGIFIGVISRLKIQ